MTTSAEPTLKVDGLSSGYGDIRAVWNVTLRAHAGEITALLGRNGAGKTTTLRAISGLNQAAEGRISFAGTDITRTPVHRRIRAGMAYVQEGKRVFGRRTVEENLFLGGYPLKLGKRRLRPRVEQMYDLFPALRERPHTLAGSLSGGQQQMLAIAQALMPRPTLLLLDEPSGGLAPAIVNEVMNEVARLKETGLAILLVEQAVEAALGVADNVAVMDVGRIVTADNAATLENRQVIHDAYFGRTTPPGT